MACNLYSLSIPPFTVYQYNILDCSGNTQTLIYPNVSGQIVNSRFCANEVLEFTGDTPSVTSGACQSNCTCFTLNKISAGKPAFTYVNCNNDLIVPITIYQDTQPAQFVDFCALYVSADAKDWTITNNGDCTTGCTFCRCIIVHNPDKDNFTFNYTDCNGVTGTTNLVSGQTVTFCGLDTDIVPGGEVTAAVNYGNKCVDDPGGDYPFKCPCKCTSVSNIKDAYDFGVNLLYVDCNGVTNFLEPQPAPGGSTLNDERSICTQNVVSVIPGVRSQSNVWAALYGNDCVDNSCPCYCYSINNTGLPFNLDYIECGSISATTHNIPTSVLGSQTSFCSPSIITQVDISEITNQALLFTGNTCSSGSCVCTCYSLTRTSELTKEASYIDCNGYIQTVNLENGTQKVCGIGLIYRNVENIDVTNEGPCIDGNCPSAPITGDCICYSIINESGEFTFPYLDCDGIQTNIVIPIGTTSFCSTSTITQADITSLSPRSVLFTGGICSSGDSYSCVCTCYSLTNTTESLGKQSYIDCFSQPQKATIPIGETVKICSIGFDIIQSGLDVVSEGPCIDGNCPSAPITGDCICYSIINEDVDFSLNFVDCGSSTPTPHNIGLGYNNFCSPSTITQNDINSLSPSSVLFTGGTCSSGSCVCNCYSLTNNSDSVDISRFPYLDCKANIVDLDILRGETQKICSTGLLYQGDFYLFLTVTNEGPCIDGECPTTPITGDCTCYYVISTNGLETIDVEIVDCDRNLPTVLTLAQGESFCAKSYISASEVGSLIGRSDGLCTGGNCPQNVNCYNIDTGDGSDVQTWYIDPEGVINYLAEPGPVNICAIAVLTEYDSTGNPVGNELGTVTNTGDCIFNETEGLYNCPAPCYCFYSFDSTFVDYINCNYESVTLSLNPGFNKICAQSVTGSDGTFFDSGLLCDNNNRCPNYCCNCYTIISEGDGTIFYLNCDLQLSEVNVSSGEPVQICALNVPPGDKYSVTLNGPCYNGQCVDTMSIQDQLLYDILTTYGPCPDICCGENEAFGGPMGIDVTDIKSGKVL